MTDPRIEAAAEHFAAVTGEPRAGRFEYTMARAALAAADSAATITTVASLHDLPVGSVILDRYGDVSQKRGTVNSPLWYSSETAPLSTWHVRKFLPARAIHWGTE